MNVTVKCFSSLADPTTCRHDQPSAVDLPGRSPRIIDLAERLRIRRQDVALVFLNGRRTGLDDRLDEGDRVAFVPPVGGM